MLQRDLAGVAQAFAPLSPANAKLGNPTPGAASQANAESGKVIIPCQILRLAGRHGQRGDGGLRELHLRPLGKLMGSTGVLLRAPSSPKQTRGKAACFATKLPLAVSCELMRETGLAQARHVPTRAVEPRDNA